MSVGFATLCVLAPNPILALMFMLGAVVNGLVLLLAAGEELMVLIFSTVYIGAIAILFLFVAIFISPETPRLRVVPLLPVVGLALFFLIASLDSVVGVFSGSGQNQSFGSSYIDFIDFVGSQPVFYRFGILLFKQYFFSTFLVSLVLFSSMLGAILLALSPVDSKPVSRP